MEIIILIIIIVGIFGLIEEQINNKREKKLDEKRKYLNISKVQTSPNQYPILKQALTRKITKPYILGTYDRRPKKGYNENLLLRVLREHFKEKIYTDIRLGSRYPDIALINEKEKFYLDIEIDEVYDLETKKIIHHKGEDEARDNHFRNYGWHVLRFSEEQVVKQTQNCCKYVAQVYAYYAFDKTQLRNFYDLDDIDFTEQWDFISGSEMANDDYRENNLGVKRVRKHYKSDYFN